MVRRTRPRLAFALTLGLGTFLAPTATAAGRLWIVGTSTCPGVHFTTVQQAVDAATDGDVILVRPTTSEDPGFTIDGKSLAIVGDERGAVRVKFASIRDLAAQQSALLLGLSAGQLRVTDNRGAVWIEDCSFAAFGGAAVMKQSTDVLMSRCSITGGGWSVPGSSPGEVGLSVSTSRVTMVDCTVTGGIGSSGYRPFGFPTPGQPGGDGIHVANGQLILNGTSVTGGLGGWGYPQIFTYCTPGGAGGDAIRHDPLSTIYLVDADVTPGSGGPGGPGALGPSCPSGRPGIAFRGTGAVHFLPGQARSLTSRRVILEREAVPLDFAGIAGDVAWLLFSFEQEPTFWLPLGGTVGPRLPGEQLLVGTLPPSGSLSTSAWIPPGVVEPHHAQLVFAQGVHVDHIGQPWLGAPIAWVILDEGHDPDDGCSP
ncbi:MAG: hypothetical protein AAF628_20835 [Planctomycetota bacterium]